MEKAKTNLQSRAQDGRAGLRRRLVTGFGAQGFQFAARIAQQILLVPLLIAVWGKPLYEDWIVLFAAASLVPLLELGTQAYFGNLLLSCWASGDVTGFARALRIALGLQAAIVGFACVAASIAFASLDWPATLGTITLSQEAALWTLLLLAAGNLAIVPQSVVNTIYRARGDFTRLVNMGTLLLVLETSGMVGAVLLGGSPVVAASVYAGAILMSWIFVVLDQRRRYPDIRYGFSLPSRDEMGDVLSKAPFYVINSATNIVVANGPVIILELLAPAGAVVAFSTSRLLVGTLRQITHQLAHASGVEMSRQYIQHDFQALRSLFNDTGRFAGGIFGFFAGIMIAGLELFFAIWTRGEVSFQPWLFAALLSGIFLALPGQAAFALLFYTNRPQPISIAHGVYAASGMILCAGLSSAYSATGAAIGLGAAEFVTVGLWLTAVSARSIDVRLAGYFARTYGVAAASFAISFAIAGSVAHLLVPRTLGELVLLGLIWSALATVPALFLLLTRSQRSWIVAAAVRRLGFRD